MFFMVVFVVVVCLFVCLFYLEFNDFEDSNKSHGTLLDLPLKNYSSKLTT